MESEAEVTFTDSSSFRLIGSSRIRYCSIVPEDNAQAGCGQNVSRLVRQPRPLVAIVGGLLAFALGCGATGLYTRWRHSTLLRARFDYSQLDLEQTPVDGRQELLQQVSDKLKSLELHSISEQQLSAQSGRSPANVEAAYDDAYCKRLVDVTKKHDHGVTFNMSFHPSAAQNDLVSRLQRLVGILEDEYQARHSKGIQRVDENFSPGIFDDHYKDRHVKEPAPHDEPIGRRLQLGLDAALKAPIPARALKATRGSSFAFVMMAHDPEDSKQEFLWGVLPMARALQKISSYRLVILTNRTRFRDGTAVKATLARLNAEVRPVYTVDMPKQIGKAGWTPTWAVAFWKLQIWTLTEFDKLIWLDSDAILYRSIDWMFQLRGVWAQRDDWFCKLKQNKVCSGILLVEPNWHDFHGLVTYAGKVSSLPGGDQQLIAEYFSNSGRGVSLLSDTDAAFGQCIGKAPNKYLNDEGMDLNGVWDIPAFVHKSGGWRDTNNNAYGNMCFSINTTLQLYRIGDNNIINVCQFHPLGPYWRDLFCEAIATIGVKLPEVEEYCNDTCWYLGQNGRGTPRDATCGPLNATVDASDYYGHTIGYPAPEIDMAKPVG